jgi:hypothetical protein
MHRVKLTGKYSEILNKQRYFVYAQIYSAQDSNNRVLNGCPLTYTRSFGINCTTVNTKIVSQIKNWTSDGNCKNGGEKCLYTVC